MNACSNSTSGRRTAALPLTFLWLALAALTLCLPKPSLAATAAEINRDVDSALQTLYRTTPAARQMAKVAKGVLVFPHIVKGGLIIGGQYGEGALRVGGKSGIVSKSRKPVAIVVPTDEERVIAEDTARLAGLLPAKA